MRTLVLACLVTALLSQTAAAQTATSAWADKLFSGVTAHDFGKVPRGVQLKYSFKMTNIYKVPLEISAIRVSCGCVTASSPVKTIQPNETALLNIAMDGRQFSGPKAVSVYVTVGPEYVSTATLSVTADARQDVVFNPGEVQFGNVQRGQSPTKAIDVEYAGNLDWQVTEIVKSGTAPFDLKVEELPRVAAVRRGYRISATLKADAAAGPFKQEIILKTNDPASPVLTFNISGSVQATLTVSPSPLTVAGLRVGEQQKKIIVIRGSRPFRVTKVEGQGEGVTVDIPNRQEATLILNVQVLPTRAGELHRQLVIHTDLDNETATVHVDATVAP